MTIPNIITLEALQRMPAGELVLLPAEELARLQKEAEDSLRKLKLVVACLDGVLAKKYADRAKAARADTGKDFGIARFQDGDVTVVADLPKKIEWNQHELGQLVERIKGEGEDPRDYIEVSLKVSERKYEAWPPYIRKLFEPARTVRAGKETFELITGDA